MNTTSLFQQIGVIRLLLVTATVACFPLVIWSDAEPVGLGILTSYVAPALVVIFFFLLLLDALMNRVFMIDAEESKQQLLQVRMRLNLAAVLGILIIWGPYFRDVGAL